MLHPLSNARASLYLLPADGTVQKSPNCAVTSLDVCGRNSVRKSLRALHFVQRGLYLSSWLFE